MAEEKFKELEEMLLDKASDHPIAACLGLGLACVAVSGILALPVMYLNARITARAVVKAFRR